MSTVISADGTPIAYSSTGHGPAVILVDGALCYRDNGPSGPLAARLAERFTVITYDRRGRGAPLPTGRWSVAAMPALVLTGGKSPGWMQAGAEQLVDVLPDARSAVLPGQTHMVSAKALAPVLEEFFAQAPTAPRRSAVLAC